MTSWIKELQDDKEILEDDPYVCKMVFEAFDIFNETHWALQKV